MRDESAPVSEAPAPQAGIRLPLAKPVVTYVLLGSLALVFLVETVAGGSESTRVLVGLGAQVNSLVAAGGLWRLVAAMFLHIGLMHLAFNGWALYSLGREVEAFYGSLRFTAIYFLAGLLGNCVFYLGGPNVLSAGASGAIFGLIGAEVAYFLQNRRLFGPLGRQRLGNLAVLIGINLVFGFTVSGINNLAHLGGLVGGFGLGLALAPRYAVTWEWQGLSGAPRLINRTPVVVQVLALVAAVAIIVAALGLGAWRWSGQV